MNSIYLIKNTVNGKVYVGQSTNTQKRLLAHRSLLRKGKHPNVHLNAAWQLYGEDAFQLYVEVEGLSDVEVDQVEIDLIAKYRAMDKCYNLDGGGKLGYTHSDETKDKIREGHAGKPKGPMSEYHKEQISKAHRNRPMTEEREKQWEDARSKRGPITEESRQKMRDSHKGKTLSKEQRQKIGEALRNSEVAKEARAKVNASNVGRVHTEEEREKISLGLRGKKFTAERIENMSLSHMGKELSDEHKRKIGDSQRGKSKPPVTEEHRKKIGDANRGKVRSDEEKARRSQTLKDYYQTPEGKACLASRVERRRAKKQLSETGQK
jgi:group I intron endonuclease